MRDVSMNPEKAVVRDMEIRQITDTYHVSPQIHPDDVETLAKAGFTTLICNRPDAEVPPLVQADAIGAAAQAAGLSFHVLPLTHQTMTPENIAAQDHLIKDAGGPVLAYCASGTRSTVVWALGQAMSQAQPVEDILAAAAAGGYALDGLRPQLELLAQSGA